jgi:hypothetical protein
VADISVADTVARSTVRIECGMSDGIHSVGSGAGPPDPGAPGTGATPDFLGCRLHKRMSGKVRE